ncbi:MAG TPA: hypothetical protein PL185_09300 [Flavobacteriales bacterium]|nr:hypothetical protein [Flavobacteriales bacterium]
MNFGVGGQEVKLDASEGIADIPLNRTLLIQKLTSEDEQVPQTVYGLKNVEDVFSHFKPSVEIEMDKADGSTVNEEFRFSNIGDFKPSTFVEKSNFLTDLSIQEQQYGKILKQIKTNKLLKNVLENPQTRSAFVELLMTLSAELNTKD